MIKKTTIFTFLLLSLLFHGCSSKNVTISNEIVDYKLYEMLKEQYIEWKGVRYKLGGYSKKGIDCSAFVQKTFKDKLHTNIPRTTAMQSKVGEEVSMNNLKTGDLIFFKTGFNTRHVGIYLKDGDFLHASTKKGVTISNLENEYYLDHFWKIQRVLY